MENDLGRDPIRQLVLRIALPSMLAQFVSVLYSVVDRMYIGNIPEVGNLALAGAGVCGPIVTMIGSVAFLVGVGGSPLVSIRMGAGDNEGARRILANCFVLLCGLAAALMALAYATRRPVLLLFGASESSLPYAESYYTVYLAGTLFALLATGMNQFIICQGFAKKGMLSVLLGAVLNIVLDPVFIFVFDMGVRGAALATLISRIMEMCVGIFYVFVVDKKLRFGVKDLLHTDRQLLRDFIRYGLPVIGGQVVWAINSLANTKILGYYSAGVIAAASITGMLHNLVYVWMNGMSSAVGIITGKTVGAGQYEKMKEYSKTVQMIFLFVGLISGAAVFLARDGFISLYNASPEAQAYSRQFINVISVTIIGTCYQAACLFGLVKSGGDISFVFKNDTIFVFLVVIPSSLLAMWLGAPPWVVFACLKCDQILKCFVAIVKINRYNWMKNLTRDNTSQEEKERAVHGT